MMQASNTYLRRTTCGLRSRSRVNQAKGGRLEGGIGPPSHLLPGKVDCLFWCCFNLHLFAPVWSWECKGLEWGLKSRRGSRSWSCAIFCHGRGSWHWIFIRWKPSLCQIHLWCVVKDGNLVRQPAAAGFLRWGAMVTPFTPTDWEQKEISFFFNSSVCVSPWASWWKKWTFPPQALNQLGRRPGETLWWKTRNASWPLLSTLGCVWPVLPLEAQDPRRRFEDRTQGNWKTNLQTSAPIWFSVVIDHFCSFHIMCVR